MSVEERLRAYAKEQGKGTLDEEKLQAAIRTSKEAFWRSETERETTWLEFLYQQATYIRKRWWAAQGGVLLVMWLALYLSDSSRQVQRYMGIMTPLFVILILPELWKNRSSGSMEVEGAAFFPIQKIYAARLLLFAMADLLLISVFLAAITWSAELAVMDILIQFVLPLNVTCCICFRTLCSRRNLNIFSALAACFSWIIGWMLLVSNDRIYDRISIPVWIGAVLVSFFGLFYSVWRMWKDSGTYYELVQ